MRAERSRLRRSRSFWSFTTLSSSWSERRSNGTRRKVSSSRVTARHLASSSFNFSSSSCFFFCNKFCSRRNRRVVPSTPSSPRSAGTTRRGASPAECRTVRSLRCGPGSRRLPGRTPGSGGFCARRPSCCSCSTPSPTLAIFGPLGAVWCVISARVIATVIRSCRSHERSRRCRLRAAAVAVSTPAVDIMKAQRKITSTKCEQPA